MSEERNTITAGILNQEISSQLYEYQINKIEREVKDMLAQNETAHKYFFDECPKCHIKNPKLIGGGRANSGKPMLRCKACNKRFNVNNGQLSWYSHQDEAKWNALITDTVSEKSLLETAADLDVSPSTAFRMRHKFLVFSQELTDQIKLSDPIELDETFVKESHKGFLDPDRPGRKRGKRDTKGISDDLVCLTTGIERLSDSYIQAYNMGRPSAAEVEPLFEKHIQQGTYIWSDGEKCFLSLMKKYGCDGYILKSTVRGDQINHLNTVNALHQKIKNLYKKYRGVSTIYINRYASLFAIKQHYAGSDIQEIVLNLVGALRKIRSYFFIRCINNEKIFDDPLVIQHRKQLKAGHGYQIPVVNDLILTQSPF